MNLCPIVENATQSSVHSLLGLRFVFLQKNVNEKNHIINKANFKEIPKFVKYIYEVLSLLPNRI